MLHENGHALGLAHSIVEGSVMEAIYDGERRILSDDDIAGVSAIYPAANPPPPPPPSDPSIEITDPATDLSVVNGKITIIATVTGVSCPTVVFTLWDEDGLEVLDVVDPDSDCAPYDTSIHTKDIPAGTYTIKAQIDLGDDGIFEDNRTIIKEPKGGGGSDDPEAGPTGGPPCSKKPLHHHCLQP